MREHSTDGRPELGPLMMRYLDDAASAEEVAELERALRADGVRRREFAELLVQCAHLAEIGREQKESQPLPGLAAAGGAGKAAPAHGTPEGTLVPLPRRRVSGRRRLWSRRGALSAAWVGPVAAAAAVLIAALFFGGLRPEPKRRHARTDRPLPAQVGVERAGAPAPAEPPSAVPDEGVRVSAAPPRDAKGITAEVLPSPERGSTELAAVRAPAGRLSSPKSDGRSRGPLPAPVGSATLPGRSGIALAPAREAAPPATSLAFVADADGAVECARPGLLRRRKSGHWLRARTGTALAAGDRVRTTLSRARIEFESGSVLFVNHWTTLTLREKAPPLGLSMVGGEVYVETVPDDTGFCVETPHGRAVDLGTRFGLDVGPAGTKVVVVEGKAEASTKEGKAEVGAGEEVLLARRTSPPGPVREARDLDKRLAWTKRDGPAGKVLLAEDFERLRSPRERFAVSDKGSARLVTDGSRCLEMTSGGELQCLAGELGWHDYTVTARFKMLPGGDRTSAALWGHYSQGKLNYRLRVYEGRVLLYKRDPVGGSSQTLAEVPFPGFRYDTWIRMRFRLENQRPFESPQGALSFAVEGRGCVRVAGKVWHDGTPEPAGWTIQFTDRTPQLATSGLAGFFVQRGTARFDDLAVFKH